MREQLGIQPKPYPRSTGTHAGLHSDDTNSLSGDLYGTRPPRGVMGVVGYQPQTPQKKIRVMHHPAGPPIPPRSSRAIQTTTAQPVLTEDLDGSKRHWLSGRHPLFYIGGTLILLLSGWFLFNLLFNWMSMQEDQLHYGYPRTYQTDKDVGHNGVSHFTVENLDGHIVVYELSGNDASQAKIYVGPTLSGVNANLAPAVVTFSDTRGKGSLDMILDVENTKYIFYNGTDGKFHEQTGS